jgi:hypothetical protein
MAGFVHTPTPSTSQSKFSELRVTCGSAPPVDGGVVGSGALVGVGAAVRAGAAATGAVGG